MKHTRFIACLLTCATALSTAPLGSAEHLVTTDELRQEVRAEETARRARARTLETFFECQAARLEEAGLDAQEVTAAVAALDSETLLRLAERVSAVNADVSAGALSNQELTYIVIALATAVLILVILAA